MQSYLKQSTAAQLRILGPFVDDTDFKSLETGLTIANTDVKLMKNGAASVNKNAGGGTHRINGDYSFTFDATDSNTVGELRVSIAVAGALVVVAKFWVLEEAIYDALFGAAAAGFDANGRVDVGSWLGTAAATPSVAGVPEVDLTHLGGTAQSATDLKDFADEGYDPATNKVQGVVLADTVTTLTNKTGFSLAATGLDAIVSTATGMIEIAKAIWDRVISKANHDISQSAGKLVRQTEASFVVAAGMAQAGTVNTITLAASESASNGIFDGDRCVITDGTGKGEHGLATTYDGTTKILTMSQNWIITPDATSEYELVPADVDVETWQHVTVTNSPTTNLPEVDAKSISDSTAAADAVTEARLAELDAGNLPADIAALNDLSAAQVNAEMVNVMDVDTVTLPGQEAPPLTPTRTEMMAWEYKVFRNEKDQSATLWQLKADDGTTVDAKATVSDAAGVATKEEIVSGP